jgi:hypothetical protein
MDMGGHMGDMVEGSLSFFTINEEEEVPAIKPVEAGDGFSPDFLLVLLRRDLTTGVLELVGDISAGLAL